MLKAVYVALLWSKLWRINGKCKKLHIASDNIVFCKGKDLSYGIKKVSCWAWNLRGILCGFVLLIRFLSFVNDKLVLYAGYGIGLHLRAGTYLPNFRIYFREEGICILNYIMYMCYV